MSQGRQRAESARLSTQGCRQIQYRQPRLPPLLGLQSFSSFPPNEALTTHVLPPIRSPKTLCDEPQIIRKYLVRTRILAD